MLVFPALRCIEPTGPPENVQGRALDSRSIELSWQPPNVAHRNGIILGYRVFYEEAVASAGNQDSANPSTETVDAPKTTLTVRNLKKYTQYNVRVLAFSQLGDGPQSSAVVVQTAEDGMLICHQAIVTCAIYL